MDRTSRHGRAAWATIAAVLVLTACAGGPGAEPSAPDPSPPPPDLVAPPPRTAAPLPEPAASPPESAPRPAAPAGAGRIPTEFGARLQEAIDRWELSDAERDCLLESGESPEAVASRSGVDDATAHAVFASGLARCLPDTFLIAEFGLAADDLGDLSEAELSCARQWLAGRGGEAFGAAYAGDAEAYTEYSMGLLGCVPSDFLAGLFDPEGEDWGYVSEAQLSCAQQWLLSADRGLLGAVIADDPAASAEFRLGLARCFPGVWFAAVFDVDVADFNAGELSCIQQWLSGVDVDVLETASSGRDREALALGLGLVACHPGALVPALFEAEAGELSENELSCLTRLLAEVDEGTLAALDAGDDAAADALWLGAVKCVPDLFLSAIVADWGLDVGDLTGNEMSCLRELMVSIDVGALETLRTGEGQVAAAFGLGLARCVPDLFLGEMIAALGLDVGDLTGHEMSCLRDWVARIDLSTLVAAAAGDEAAAAALDLGLIACVGDRIPPYDDGIRTRWGIA